jgi:hypothetical protein
MIGQQPDGTLVVEKVQTKKSISISQMNILSQCGEKYRRQYIMREYSPRALSMIVGSVIHEVVASNLRAKIQSGMLLKIEEVTSMARIKFREAINEAQDRARSEGFEWGIHFKEEELLDGRQESINEAQSKAVRLSRLHAELVAPSLNPLFVERPLWVELPGYPFDMGGILDVEEFDSVRDTKTKSKSPSKGDSLKEDQLTAYAFLRYMKDGVIPPRLILDCLVDTKVPKYVPDESNRTEDDFDVLLRRIDAASYAIDKQVFIPARETDWWCGKNACSFWQTCKYVKQSRRPAA